VFKKEPAMLKSCALLLAVLLHAGVTQLEAQSSQFQLVREIGLEDGPVEYLFGRVAGVAAQQQNGEILVLDGLAKLVHRFDATGRHLGTFGREGAGPGEFNLPSRLHLANDEVWVSDARLQRLTVFDRQGRSPRVIRPPEVFGAVDVAYPLKGGLWLAEKSVGLMSSGEIRRLASIPAAQQRAAFAAWRATNNNVLVVLRPGSSKPDTLATWDRGSISWFEEGGRSFSTLPRSWGPAGHWNIGGDSIVVHVNSVMD
jgi:hypothetical protein